MMVDICPEVVHFFCMELHIATEPYIDPTPHGITHATNVRDKNVLG